MNKPLSIEDKSQPVRQTMDEYDTDRTLQIKTICDYFNKKDSGSKGALMHVITTYFPPKEKLSGSIESVLEKLPLSDLTTIANDCAFNTN